MVYSKRLSICAIMLIFALMTLLVFNFAAPILAADYDYYDYDTADGNPEAAVQYGIHPLWLFITIFIAAILLIRLRRYKNSIRISKMTDAATGIGNKDYFIYSFGKKITDESRTAYAVAYLGFDIARVNSYYSETESEAELAYAASELQKSASKSDIIARIGGGSFAVAHMYENDGEAKQWLHALLHRLNQYCVKFDGDYRPEFKAGLYFLTQSDRNCEAVLRSVKHGYSHAVQHGRLYTITDAVLLDNERERELLHKHTIEAIKTHEFKLYIQLIVSAADGSVVGGEALSRWENPEFGLLEPSRYIDMMSSEGTIVKLDFYMFEEACRQLEKWQSEAGRRDLFLSCNFTRISIHSSAFIKNIREILEKYDFDHSKLIIEMIEDAISGDEILAVRNIAECKNLGFMIALDDVGSGHTSFSDLRDYPIDIIKIDRSILSNAETERGKALLAGIISLSHGLGMKVLCEGVETKQHLALLKDLGCDYLQGYYFYRAVPADEAITGEMGETEGRAF